MKVELKVVGGARAGQLIPVNIPQFMIGRAEDCHLKPRSELISRYHCAILSEEAYAAVRDLGSKNGVYVNGERIVGEQELHTGDHVVIGPLEFEIVLTTAVKAPAKPKVTNVAEVVARTVEQNSINVAEAKKVAAAAQPVAPAQPAPAPAQPVAAAQPAPAPAQPAAAAQPAPAPAQPAAPAKPAVSDQRTATHTSSTPASSDDDDDLAWLLGEDDEDSEAQTVSASLADLDLPFTPKEEEQEKPAEEEKPKKAGMPNSSDAAANLLKNFFKGGR